MKAIANGLLTGLTLQLAIGPVFFFIVNLTLQMSALHGFAGVLAVTMVDLLYISLAILGIGRLLQQKFINKILRIVGPIVLIIFGILIVRAASIAETDGNAIAAASVSASFASVFVLTISSPMTILFFTGIFSTKALEYRYTRRELWSFGMGTGLATLLFMSTAVITVALLGNYIPFTIVHALNTMVGVVLIGYGALRLYKSSL